MLQKSTIQLLRFHFSFFLLPVYLFAVSQVPDPDWWKAIAIFLLLHLLVYPSSNGYNSYMDRDESSIGGIEKPMSPTRQLFVVSIGMDLIALAASIMISSLFFACLLAYILASRAYSYRGIRLKKYPIIGYLTVTVFQGAVTYFMVYHGTSQSLTRDVSVYGLIAASLLMGSFYPLTQIYQHQQDLRDGVKTISYLLGYRGTFIFTAVIYSMAMSLLALYFSERGVFNNFLLLATFLLPVLVYFFIWAAAVWKNVSAADFRHTMKMNLLASVCSNLAFLTILIGRWI